MAILKNEGDLMNLVPIKDEVNKTPKKQIAGLRRERKG